MEKSVVVFGTETWAVAEMDMKKLGTWEGEILVRVHRTVIEQGMWRVRTEQELRELYKELDIVADVKRKRLEWTGHIVRMDQGRTVKKILESKPDGSRRRETPTMRWLEDVENNLREMKFKRRRQKTVDREEWAFVINEVKALRGP
jgi:hypothetical protein